VIALYVFLAGGAGALARYGISNQYHGDSLVWSVVGINVVGSFALGLLLALPADWMSPQVRTTLGVGFLGGFTTFSTFSAQAWADIEAGEPGRALLYVGVSVLAGIAAAAAGFYLARAIR
jgi:CrcB protein